MLASYFDHDYDDEVDEMADYVNGFIAFSQKQFVCTVVC